MAEGGIFRMLWRAVGVGDSDHMAHQFGIANEVGKPGPVIGVYPHRNFDAKGNSIAKEACVLVVTPKLIERFDMRTGKLQKSTSLKEQKSVSASAFGRIPEGSKKVLFCGSQDETIRVFDMLTLKQTMHLTLHGDLSESNAEGCALVEKDGSLNQKGVAKTPQSYAITSIAINNSLQTGCVESVFAGTDCGKVRVWSIPSGLCTGALPITTDRANAGEIHVASLVIIPSTEEIWVGYGDGLVDVHDLSTRHHNCSFWSVEQQPICMMIYSSLFEVVLMQNGSEYVTLWRPGNPPQPVCKYPTALMLDGSPLLSMAIFQEEDGMGTPMFRKKSRTRLISRKLDPTPRNSTRKERDSQSPTAVSGGGITAIGTADSNVAEHMDREALLLLGGVDGSFCVRRLIERREGDVTHIQCILLKRFPAEEVQKGLDCPLTHLSVDSCGDAVLLGSASTVVVAIRGLKNMLYEVLDSETQASDSGLILPECEMSPRTAQLKLANTGSGLDGVLSLSCDAKDIVLPNEAVPKTDGVLSNEAEASPTKKDVVSPNDTTPTTAADEPPSSGSPKVLTESEASPTTDVVLAKDASPTKKDVASPDEKTPTAATDGAPSSSSDSKVLTESEASPTTD
eukprot:Platyproteum_vivax@DN1543_c0_g1_i1.p1